MAMEGEPPHANTKLQNFREQYHRLDLSRCGSAEDRAALHEVALNDWHGHRLRACEDEPDRQEH